MSEADDAFLHVHLDHVQPKSWTWSQDYGMPSGSAIWLQIWTVQEPELTAKMLQDCWLSNIAYQESVLKDKLDKHCARCVAWEIQPSFLGVPYCCDGS